MTTEITETEIKTCNVCGSDGTDKVSQYASEFDSSDTLVQNPGYKDLFMCGKCFHKFKYPYIKAMRRLGLFGTIKEPRKANRVFPDEAYVQPMIDDLVRRIRERKLKIRINLGDV